MLRRWLGAFHVTGVFWFRFHRWGARVLPTWLIAPTVLVFTCFFFVVLRRARAAVVSNLVPVLGPCGWWRRQIRIFKTLLNFAWCLTERYEQMSTDRVVEVEIDGESEWQRALDNPKGFVLVTAHIGHWETGSMLAPSRHVHVVREEELDPQAQTFMRQMFAEQAGETGFTMHFVQGDPVLGMKLLAALRRGEIVALQGDRPRTDGRVLTTSLFGQPFGVPLGPPALARAADVAMLPAYVFREGRYRARVAIRPPIQVPSTGRAGLEAAAHQIATEIEWAVREHPHQWFTFRKLWPRNVD